MVGQRQRYRHLNYPACRAGRNIAGPPDRVLSLLAKARVVDDPGLNGSPALDRRQHRLAHLGRHRRVRPRRLANKMKQRLVLRRDLGRCRYRRHRLDALAGNRHQQPETMIARRRLPVGMAKHLAKRLDIGGKSRFAPSPAHLPFRSPNRASNRLIYCILQSLPEGLHHRRFFVTQLDHVGARILPACAACLRAVKEFMIRRKRQIPPILIPAKGGIHSSVIPDFPCTAIVLATVTASCCGTMDPGSSPGRRARDSGGMHSHSLRGILRVGMSEHGFSQ